ncbi:MAG TPA: alcohol dehydrogenase catalytic domain-containing protein [Acidimicrobiales bacterium]
MPCNRVRPPQFEGAVVLRQLAYVKAGRVEWQDVPEPELTDPAGALLRPLAVARCDLDLPMVLAGTFPAPFAVGHEFVAEVLSVGDQVTKRRVGEPVLVPFQPSCGGCVACEQGRFAACHRYRAPAGGAFGFGSAGGGHGGAVADVVAVPSADHLLLLAPEGIPTTALCTLPDNLVDAYRAVGPPLSERPGAEVLIVGSAAVSIGLYAVVLAAGLGACNVRYIDRDPERCAIASELGADVHLHDGPWPRRFDRAPITVDNSGDPEGLACTLRSTDDYGVCTGIAIHFTPTTPVPLLDMYTKGVTFHVSRADSRRYLPAVLDLVAEGKVSPMSIPTTVVDWEQAHRSWLEPAIKLVIER